MVKREKNAAANALDSDIDALYKLPLADFTGARNELAASLKKAGRTNDANLTKTLAKPPISAWAVNQLYWNHRESFDQLLLAGERLRQLQSSGLAGKVAEMRAALDSRRDALAHLSDLATSLLQKAGHSPTLDTIRRVTATLEALSALSDGPTPGRLSADVDPPGFESFGSFAPGVTQRTAETKRPAPPTKPETVVRMPAKKPAAFGIDEEKQKARKLEDERKLKITAATTALQFAKKRLANAREKAQRQDSLQKKSLAEAKQAEAAVKQASKELRDAEERFKQASANAEDATKRSKAITGESRAAALEVEEAKRALDKASKELELLRR